MCDESVEGRYIILITLPGSGVSVNQSVETPKSANRQQLGQENKKKKNKVVDLRACNPHFILYLF